MTRLGKGALVAGIAGAALFLSMFGSWFDGESGWSSIGWLGVAVIALAIVAAVSCAIVLYSRASISLPIALATLACALGLLALIAVIYRLLDPPGDGDVSRELCAWLGLAATAAIVLGGYVGMQEERPG